MKLIYSGHHWGTISGVDLYYKSIFGTQRSDGMAIYEGFMRGSTLDSMSKAVIFPSLHETTFCSMGEVASQSVCVCLCCEVILFLQFTFEGSRGQTCPVRSTIRQMRSGRLRSSTSPSVVGRNCMRLGASVVSIVAQLLCMC